MTSAGRDPLASGGPEVGGDQSDALPESPYRGLEPYRFCDRAIFFEREAETERLIRLTAMYRGALLYGESGAGKSSLINAGLIPKLIAEGTIVERLRVQPRRGREMVVERISRAGPGGDFLPSVLGDTQEDGATFISAEEFPDRVRAASGAKLVLIFDQFEELLTLTSEGSEDSGASQSRNRILDSIVSLLQDRKMHHARFLFVFREEYLAKFERFFYFCPDLPDQFLRLIPPRANALRRLIRGPFEAENIPKGHWKQELSEEVAAALEEKLRPGEDGTPINLSQVQIAVLQLWRSEKPASILEHRGVDGLVSDYLRDQLAKFRKDQPTAEILMSLMITLHGTRKIVEAAELVELARALRVPAEKTARTVEKLVSETRLVRRDYNRGATTYEIVSEFLVPWIRALKLRRAARDVRIFWMRRALGLVGILTLVLAAIFAIRYEKTTVEAQKDILVRAAQQKQAMAESNEATLQKQMKETLALLSQGKDAQFRSLMQQLNNSREAAAKARMQAQESTLQVTALKDQADKYSSDLASANQNLARASAALETQTKTGKALQERLDALEKIPPQGVQNTVNSAGTGAPPKAQAPGPVPPPLVPVVDSQSRLVPDAVVKENFGASLSKNYFVYEITIGNNTGSAIFFQVQGFRDKAGHVISPRDPGTLSAALTSSQTARLFGQANSQFVVQNNATARTIVFIPKALVPQADGATLTPIFTTTAIAETPRLVVPQPMGPGGAPAPK